MTDYYKGARDYRFFPDFVGKILSQEEVDSASQLWVEACESGPILTEEIWDDMTKEQRKPYSRGTMIWGSCCGLRVKSGGEAFTIAKTITDRLDKIARARAREGRKAAGWTDEKGRGDYLVAPDGSTRGPANMPYGPYTFPDAYYNSGNMWDGVLTPDVRFIA